MMIAMWEGTGRFRTCSSVGADFIGTDFTMVIGSGREAKKKGSRT
jgi:hypothetical protein